MIMHQLALVRRELWEHRSIIITPIIIGALWSLAVLATGGIAEEIQAELDINAPEVGIALASTVATDLHRSAMVNGLLFIPSTIIFFGMSILVFFYSLDSLYAERKDKSILFWRSLPITDAETVISKALTAGVAIPLVMLYT